MAKLIKLTAMISMLLAIVFSVAYIVVKASIFLTLGITFGTIAYHFVMRLVIGFIFDKTMNNRADYTKGWYKVSNIEQRIYRKLNVKKWKKHMPSYDAELFDASRHSWDDIAQAMCQSELVHETIVILSFVPLIFSIWFGAFPISVSIISARRNREDWATRSCAPSSLSATSLLPCC